MANRIENIIIAAVSAIIAIALTVTIIQVTSIRTLKKEIARQAQRIENQDAVIVELAKIEKYKIENTFDKVKAKDGQIALQLDNKLEALKLDTIIKEEPAVEKKKGFWRNLKFW